ncbi:MAG TPA: alkaline phosphatase D family protein [Sedimentisphaerales bacterium]|nr:alkaline phosphatase D family protein [Sedimentisphaerales bacterium]
MISKSVINVTMINFLLAAATCSGSLSDGPYQATGIKIGEVTYNTAIVWTRLTRNPERVGSIAPLPEITYRNPKTGKIIKKPGGRPDLTPIVNFPEDSTIETIEGAVPGAPGRVRVLYKIDSASDWRMTGWEAVDPKRDYTRQFMLTGLKPDSKYKMRVESREMAADKNGQTVEGGFRTAPRVDQSKRVVFTVTTGQAYPDQDAPGGGYKMYSSMLKLDPGFFVHTGDIVYYDKLAKSLPLARWHWARMYSLPTNVEFHRQVASYFIKDDHDTWFNDCWPDRETRFMGDFTFEQGQKVFLEQVPMGERTWRTFRWGRDIQIWLPEGRDFRSPNTMADGPGKTIWGKEQKQWFKRTVRESDAAFRFLISPTPLVGPDRKNKHDNHSNADFTHEGDELRQFVSQQKNMYIICGDRHWQYISVDSKTGAREYSCGPASDKHAGGWSNDQRLPEHRYLNVIGGFLAVTVDRQEGKPTLTFRFYDVDGNVLKEDRPAAQ